MLTNSNKFQCKINERINSKKIKLNSGNGEDERGWDSKILGLKQQNKMNNITPNAKLFTLTPIQFFFLLCFLAVMCIHSISIGIENAKVKRPTPTVIIYFSFPSVDCRFPTAYLLASATQKMWMVLLLLLLLLSLSQKCFLLLASHHYNPHVTKSLAIVK